MSWICTESEPILIIPQHVNLMIKFGHPTEHKVIQAQGTKPHQLHDQLNHVCIPESNNQGGKIFTFHQVFFYVSDESSSCVSFENLGWSGFSRTVSNKADLLQGLN